MQCTYLNLTDATACDMCGGANQVRNQVQPKYQGTLSAESKTLLVTCHFSGPWGEAKVVYPEKELLRVQPYPDVRLVHGAYRSRRELVLHFGGNVAAAQDAWTAANVDSGSIEDAYPDGPSAFASCVRGHPLHARCFQARLVGGQGCPCGEAFFRTNVQAKGEAEADDCGSCGSGGSSAGERSVTSLQAALEGVSAASAVLDRSTSEAGAAVEGHTLRMCPCCFAGPLLNEHCGDLNQHHGDCPKCRSKLRNASEAITAALTKLKGSRVCDVLPKCPKCAIPVMFNGCGACGALFNSLRWV